MVKDGGCPFMFDGALSFDRVLMPALRVSAALKPPFHHFVVPLPHRWGRQVYSARPPSPIDGGGKGIVRGPPPPIDEEASV